MNRYRIALFLLCVAMPTIGLGLRDHTSQSFMFTRAAYHRVAEQQAGWHQLVNYNTHDLKAHVQGYGYYQKSVNNDDKIRTAAYFLPRWTDTIYIKGDDKGTDRDVRAEYVGLPSDFSGTLSLDPHQQQGGFVLEYHHSLSYFFKHDFFRDTWVAVFLPFVHVRNNLRLSQSITAAGTPAATDPADILEAFNQDDWNFGRLRTGTHTQTGIAELRFKWGKRFMARNNCEINLYSTCVIPTHRPQHAQFLFDPLVGMNDHYAMGTGALFQFPLFEYDAGSLNFFANIEQLVRFGNHQRRTFDLKDKPWSRFLLLTAKDAAAGDSALPGVNVLTQEVKVHAYNVVDLSTGIRYVTDGGVELEAGYNLWAHPSEHLCLRHAWQEIYGIRGSTSAVTASASTIAELGDDDDTFVPITECDLDFASAAARSAITHTVHLALSYIYRGDTLDAVATIGALYEYSQNNAALNVAGVWGKIAIAV